MAKSASFTFDDPILYTAAFRHAEAEVLACAKENFRAKLMQISFDRVYVTSACENVPRVIRSMMNPKRTFISFLADARQPPAYYSGLETPSNSIAVTAGGSRHFRASDTCRWAMQSLTQDDLSAASCALLGRELTAEPVTRLVHPDPADMRRLVGLHAAARHLTDAAPDILEQPEVSRALEHELINVMVTCMADSTEPEARAGWRHHTAIIKRFEELLDANCDRPMYLADICAAVGASERTLEISCEEHLGMGPIRYLLLRRMHLARRALIQADPANTTVTQIATGHGFWELGRFAVSYKRLFGESPSASLHRPAGDWRATQNRPSEFVDSEFA